MSYYHLGFVVQNIATAASEMTETLGVTWNSVRKGRLGEWDYRIVFSVEGPPFFELVEGPPGSPWDASGGSRFDHLGYWVDEIDSDKEALADRGAALDFDATTLGRPFAYHCLDSLGTRVELVDRSVQAGFISTWAPHLTSMPSLHLDCAGSQPPTGRTPDGVEACRATLIDFLSAIDHGQATIAVDLFTSDASFAARDEQLHGAAEIAAFLRKREAEIDRETAHVIANDVVRSSTDDEIVLEARLLLYERAGASHYALCRILETTQTFERNPDRWRIRARSIRSVHP